MQEEVGVGTGAVEYEDLFVGLEVTESEALSAVQLLVEVRCDLQM